MQKREVRGTCRNVLCGGLDIPERLVVVVCVMSAEGRGMGEATSGSEGLKIMQRLEVVLNGE